MPTFCDIYLGACRNFFLFIFYAFTENFTKYLIRNQNNRKNIKNPLIFPKLRYLSLALRV